MHSAIAVSLLIEQVIQNTFCSPLLSKTRNTQRPLETVLLQMNNINESNLIISVHVPKTAGTTLSSIFDRCFARRVIYDYDGYLHPDKASLDIIKGKEFISNYFKVLHGHFYVSKYQDLFPEAKYISTVRHPVERVISQFHHEINEKSSDAWYHDDLISGRMDVVEFARQPGIGNAYELHLGAKPIEKYDLIFVQEYFDHSLRVFDHYVAELNLETHYGSVPKIPTLNRGDSRPTMLQISENTKKEIFNATHTDNAIYGEAVELLLKKLRHIGL